MRSPTSTATVVVVDPDVVVDATVVVGAMVVVVVEADVVELLIDVVVGTVVDVVVAPVDETPGDGTSVACPVVEQATVSSRDPSPIRIGTP